MNDEQLMNQIKKYLVSLNEIKDIRNTQPSTIHNLFIAICRNVILLNLDETKIDYVLELEENFSNLKRAWVDLRNNWGTEQEKMLTEIRANLKDNLTLFTEIRERSMMQENLNETKKTINCGCSYNNNFLTSFNYYSISILFRLIFIS